MADKRKTSSEKKQKSQAATLKEVICRLGRYRIFLVFSIGKAYMMKMIDSY